LLQPHRAAAAASIASGLAEYVDGLNVPRRSKKAWAEAGAQSLVEDGAECEVDAEVEADKVKGSTLRVRAAVLERMLVKVGVRVRDPGPGGLHQDTLSTVPYSNNVNVQKRFLGDAFPFDAVLRKRSI
jgi:hypothetical protein